MLHGSNTPSPSIACRTSLLLLHLSQHPLVVAVLLLGSCVLVVGVVGWTWSGIQRGRAAAAAAAAAGAGAEAGPAGVFSVTTAGQRAAPKPSTHDQGAASLGGWTPSGAGIQEAGGPASAATPPPAAAHGVTVVMPLRGWRPQAWDNWKALLGSSYQGPLEVLFVVDSAKDPAAVGVQQLMDHLGYQLLPQQQPIAAAAAAAPGYDLNPAAAEAGAAAEGDVAAGVRQRLPATKLIAQWAAPAKHEGGVHPKLHGQQQQWPDKGLPASMGAATAHVAVQQPSCLQRGKLLQAPPAAEASSRGGGLPGHASAAAAGRWRVRLLEAGRASTCSQKIHNQLAGLRAADTRRSCCVLFLDDDVLLHPSSISDLLEGLEHTTTTTSSSSSSGHTSSNTAGDSTQGCGDCSSKGSDRSSSCGPGPCRRSSSSHPSAAQGDTPHGGGCAACCQQQRWAPAPHRRPFMATGYPYDLPPPGGTNLLGYAVLVYHLPLLIGFSVAPTTPFVWGGCMMMRLRDLLGPDSLVEVWRNGGYSDDLLAAGYCSARGYTIAVPPRALFPQVLQPRYSAGQYWNYLRRQLFVLDTYQGPHDRRLNHTLMVVHAACSGALAGSCVAAAAYLLCLGLWVLLGCERLQCREQGGADTSTCLLAPTAAEVGKPWWQPAVWSFLVVVLAAQWSVWWMHTQVLQLWRQLQPCAPAHILHPHMSWLRLWAGLVWESLLLPACMLHTFCCDRICWAGIRYQKNGGKTRVV